MKVVLLAVTLGLGAATAQKPEEIDLDYSHCGYRSSLHPLPEVPARIVVPVAPGDATARLQAAIDQLGKRPLDGEGFRGAVLLEKGRYEIGGQLVMEESGVVLRGAGVGSEGTVLLAVGQERRPLIRVAGEADRHIQEDFHRKIVGDLVPAGATWIPLDTTDGLSVGDAVIVTRPSTQEWIDALGMDRFLVSWKPGSRDVEWERRVVAIENDRIRLDAGLTTALESRFGGGRVESFSWPGRIERIGIENLELESQVASDRPTDEDHSWVGVTMENVKDAWVRQVTFRKFAGSAVMLWESVKNVTVRDCLALEPVSEIGGHRRHTFFTMGQQTLFFRCWSEHGFRDFAAGHCAAGPNAFVYCEAHRALGDSGPMGSWASGVLYDNVKIDGAALRLENQWVRHHGAGWTAANCMIWQSSAAEIHLYNPPTARNQARGVWGRPFGDGAFESVDEFVKPASLFQEQLGKRSRAMAEWLGPIGLEHRGATNPSYKEAEAFVAESNRPQRTLREVIEAASRRDAIDTGDQNLPEAEGPPPPANASSRKALQLVEGRLLMDGKLRIGEETSVPWWRGNTRPGEAPELGRAITRFVPGRVGLGFTDELREVADWMVSGGMAALEHHHGLWYDRRRDDHSRVRRADGDVSAPFYEQPFARSGRGTAWDGLSLYDLERPNPWYWGRLKRFADLADAHGLVLYHQNYFQHNILEAGAHWADSPWRTANNVNGTGFPEPPPYAGDKRIFQAHLFYEVNHGVRRRLHRKYIRQCLANFTGNENVIQLTGAEYTGPLSFMQFWIDTVTEWERETGNNVLLGLSCTKDVQDAILQDPVRGPAVSLIDIRYWHFTKDGALYAPEGGKNLSPRQHARRLRPRSSSFGSIVRAVREYRERYPEKAVVYHAGLVAPGSNDGWAVLMGGGSLPGLTHLPEELLTDLTRMHPTDDVVVANRPSWCLGGEPGYLIYAEEPIRLEDVTVHDGEPFTRHWIDPVSGEFSEIPRRVMRLRRADG